MELNGNEIMSLPDPDCIDFVIYHADCVDGFGAAYAAWKRIGDSAVYCPAKHGSLPPDVTDKNVAIIDFSYKRSAIQKMFSQAKSLVVLDHHKTARDELAGLDYVVFDMDHSGAMLSWEYFHPTRKPPLLIQLIQDVDLWKFEFAATRDFMSVFYNVPYDFREYDAYCEPFSAKMSSALSEGRITRKFMDDCVAKLCKTASLRKLKTYDVCVVNSSQFMSDIGMKLSSSRNCDVGMVWYFDHHNKTCCVSLRSSTDAVDVSEIALCFGGGGHTRAAGFRWAGDIEDIFDK